MRIEILDLIGNYFSWGTIMHRMAEQDFAIDIQNFEAILYDGSFTNTYLEKELSKFGITPIVLLFSYQIEFNYYLTINLWNPKHEMNWENTMTQPQFVNCDDGNTQYISEIFIDNYQKNYILKFNLFCIEKDILIDTLRTELQLCDILNCKGSCIWLKLSNGLHFKEILFEVKCKLPKTLEQENDMLIRLDICHLENQILTDGLLSVEVYSGSRNYNSIDQDLKCLFKTPYLIALNSTHYKINNLVYVRCNFEDILIIAIRRHEENGFAYWEQLDLENIAPFQKNCTKIGMKKYECDKGNFLPTRTFYNKLNNESSPLDDSLHSRVVLTMEIYYEYYMLNGFVLNQFLIFPSDDFHQQICYLWKTRKFAIEFDCSSFQTDAILNWAMNSELSLDFVTLKKLFSERFIARLLQVISVSQLKNLFDTFLPDTIANIFLDGGLSSKETKLQLIKIFDSEIAVSLYLLEFLYTTLSTEDKLAIETHLMESPDLFDYYSEFLPFTSGMMKKRVVTFLATSTFTNWVSFNYLSNTDKVNFLIEQEYFRELKELIQHKFNLSTKKQQMKFLATTCKIPIDKCNKIYQTKTDSIDNYFYVIHFAGTGFPTALKISSLIYRCNDILAELIEEIQRILPECIIKPYSATFNLISYDFYQCIFISAVEILSKSTFELFSKESFMKHIFEIDASHFSSSHVTTVISIDDREFSTMAQAIQTLQEKIDQLEKLYQQAEQELQMSNIVSDIEYSAIEEFNLVINGCLDASVNGGIFKYKRLLSKTIQESESKRQLSALIEKYEQILTKMVRKMGNSQK